MIDLVDRYGGHRPEEGGRRGDEGEKGKGVVVLAWGAWAAKRVAKMDKVRRVGGELDFLFALCSLARRCERTLSC